MSEKKIASLAELLEASADDTEYAVVDVFGTRVRLGSLPAGHMLDWLEANEDPTKRRDAGIRLVVQSIVDEDGNRVSDADIPKYLLAFRNKNNVSVSKVVAEILKLNGMHTKAELLKNESGGTPAASSPSA